MKFTKRAIVVLAPWLVVCISTHWIPASANEFKNGAEKFVQSLADDAVLTLTSKKISETQRQNNFRKLFRNYFDVDGIGKWALGRYWRKATKKQRSEYLALFEDLIVTTYAGRFENYSNEQLEIKGSVSRGKITVVKSHFNNDKKKPIRVDWRVTLPDGKYKIFDIVVEGVSLVKTQRHEFSSVIRRNDGNVSGLLAALRKKTSNKIKN